MSETKVTVLKGSSTPHAFAPHTTSSIMRDVVFAMVPILVFATLYFGYQVLVLTAISVATCVLSEYAWNKIFKKPNTVWDFSAVVTGLLLAFNLPASAPWWMPIMGGVFAIIITKQLFGGIGHNFVNPALAARCFLLVSWSSIMVRFQVDGVTVATPLSLMADGNMLQVPSYMSCFLGVIPGALGETSKVLILLGGVYLLARRVIDFRIPLAFIGTVFVLSYVFGRDGLYQILSGGLFLGAFFMATDYTTSPMNSIGKWIFGFGCGLMTVLIRFFGGYPEGVSFAILLMNLCVPLIDRFTIPRPYGVPGPVKREAKGKEERA